MNEIDEALESVFNPSSSEKQRADAQATYEESVMKKIMTLIGLESQIRQLIFKVKEKTGRPKLTFNSFYAEYPGFPLWLSIRRLPYVHDTKVATLFSNFPKTLIAQTWAEANDECQTDGPTALVFPFPAMRGKHLICVNAPLLYYKEETILTHRLKSGHTLWLTRLEPALKSLLTDWNP